MDNDLLFQGEEIISESENKVISLTTHRIRLNDSSIGSSHLVSIMLDKVSSIEVRYKSWWILLILSILLIIGGLWMGMLNNGEAMMVGIVVGLLLGLFYVFSRKHVIVISSDGGTSLNFHTKGMKREKIMEFINKIERAKSEYSKKVN